jgi:hypothetical protein
MSKVFFTHTTKLDIVKAGVVPAATIAIKRVGNKFHYGVAICSKFDNFSKKYGREVAENRLNQEFGILDIPAPLANLSEREATLAQLYNLAASVVVKSKKWKKRVTKFNLAQKQGGKVINLTNTEKQN